MAQRRMFSKEITNSSEFLMMSQSAQNLYFHFGMNADDDGFCEVFTIMRMTDSKPDDLASLHNRGFLYVVDSKVCIIKDWHENNQLRLDRYKKSKYLEDPKYLELYSIVMEDKIKEISLYTELLKTGIPNGNQLVPQDSIGESRIGENNTYQNGTGTVHENKDITITKNNSNEKQTKKCVSITVPSNINLNSWNEWLDYRKAKKKPVSEIAAKKQFALLEKYTFDEQKEIVNTSISNDYQGLFDLRANNKRGKSIAFIQ